LEENVEFIFVYNAKSDNVSMLIDYAHKMISPSTYSCDLCKLTHTNFGQRKEWKNFTKNSSVKLDFYHIDEFEKKFNKSFTYPAVLKKRNNQLVVLIDREEISKLKNVNDLINVIGKKTESNNK